MFEGLTIKTVFLESALDAAWARNEVVSQNIANAETPDYKRKTVKFEEFLDTALNKGRQELKVTNHRHLPGSKTGFEKVPYEIAKDNKNLSIRLDGNNVDIEQEMAAMAKNTIQYNALTQKLNGEFRKLQSVISEGRK